MMAEVGHYYIPDNAQDPPCHRHSANTCWKNEGAIKPVPMVRSCLLTKVSSAKPGRAEQCSFRSSSKGQSWIWTAQNEQLEKRGKDLGARVDLVEGGHGGPANQKFSGPKGLACLSE